jgi:hypothetical protein
MKSFFSIIVISCFLLFFSCQKEYSYEKGATVGEAKGSLKDSLGNCLPDSVHGTFYNGVTPGSDTAFVDIQVNVDSAGNYHIYTDLQNGFMFADSGFFTNTGITTVRLKPIGTPILNMPTSFIVTFDTTACGFTINVQDSTGTGLGGGGNPGGGTDSTNLSDTAWKFSVDAGGTFNGPIDSAFLKDTTFGTFLVLVGSTVATGDSAFVLSVPTNGGVITPGTYTTDTSSVFYLYDLTAGVYIYSANVTTAPGSVVTITISSYDPVTKIVTGTFSGTATDASSNIVTISNGSFKVKVT